MTIPEVVQSVGILDIATLLVVMGHVGLGMRWSGRVDEKLVNVSQRIDGLERRRDDKGRENRRAGE